MAMKRDWWSCDGGGSGPRPHDVAGPASPVALTRRGLLVTTGLATVGWLAQRTALAQVALQPGSARTRGDVLVTIFLRGGLDGLSVVVPYAEDAYHRARPSLRLAAPNDAKAGATERVLDLDGFFGLNPALSALLPLYREGKLGFVHACGSDDHTRSHFEAMSAMERGLDRASSGAASGWISRHLAATEPAHASPLRAVAISSTMPDSLRGATSAIAVEQLSDFRLDGGDAESWQSALRDLYGNGKDAMSEAGLETLQVLETLRKLEPKEYRPSGGANYPKSDLGEALKQVALLIKADVGLEVACLDKGGWDTHVAQGALTGWLAGLLKDLGDALAAFSQDLGPEMARVSVVVQTEFGRRVEENSGLGTDHGRASTMFLLGGGAVGGKVFADWPGLEPQQLEDPGDLRVTTDYRDVLANVLRARVPGSDPPKVFPNYRPAKTGFVRPLA